MRTDLDCGSAVGSLWCSTGRIRISASSSFLAADTIAGCANGAGRTGDGETILGPRALLADVALADAAADFFAGSALLCSAAALVLAGVEIWACVWISSDCSGARCAMRTSNNLTESCSVVSSGHCL